MTEDKNWATPSLKEAPFWMEGMTPEEYDAEREYFDEHYEDYVKGKYKPLWKQKMVISDER